MYTFFITLKQTFKLFASSVLCSALFIHFLAGATAKPVVCFILLLVSMILFLFICDKIFFSLCDDSRTIFEYLIPSAVSFAIYSLTAFLIFNFGSMNVYNWMFLPTRFLSTLMRNALTLAYIIPFVLLLFIIVRFPIEQYRDMKNINTEQEYTDNIFTSAFLDVVSLLSYYITSILKYSAILFTASLLCSLAFGRVLNTVYEKELVYFMLLLASMVAFAFACNILFRILYENTDSTFEHMLSSLCAFALYVVVSLLLFRYRISNVYNLIFLPTRFIESIYKDNIIVSYIISYIILLLIILRIPFFNYIYRRRAQKDALSHIDDLEFMENIPEFDNEQ